MTARFPLVAPLPEDGLAGLRAEVERQADPRMSVRVDGDALLFDGDTSEFHAALSGDRGAGVGLRSRRLGVTRLAERLTSSGCRRAGHRQPRAEFESRG